ncbi:MAG: ketopantoate reductase family protein [Phycisphaeraceae bacterium]|nr:ketopantoate reductase family protein [Phycisphaeraceae bacterium]
MTLPDYKTWNPHRLAIIGAGAMGIGLAAMLGRFAPVTIVARRHEVASRICQEGASVRGGQNATSWPDTVDTIAELGRHGPISAVFVATKTSAIDDVAAELASVLVASGDGGLSPFVVSFQNGIEPGRRLIDRLGDPRVLRMVLNYSARLEPDGVVRIVHEHPPHYIGCLDPDHLPVCRTIAALLTRCGLQTVATADIEPLVWRKGLINAAVNPVAALMNASVGEVLDSPARKIVDLLLAEGLAVATAEGIELGAGALGELWNAIEAARPHTPSMVEDIRLGRVSEVGQLNRQVISHAERVGISTPTHETIASLIDAFDWRVFQRISSGVERPRVIHAG